MGIRTAVGCRDLPASDGVRDTGAALLPVPDVPVGTGASRRAADPDPHRPRRNEGDPGGLPPDHLKKCIAGYRDAESPAIPLRGHPLGLAQTGTRHRMREEKEETRVASANCTGK